MVKKTVRVSSYHRAGYHVPASKTASYLRRKPTKTARSKKR